MDAAHKKRVTAHKKKIVEAVTRKVRTRYVVYQSELVRCGKPNCSKWHGPYWYAYWKKHGRTKGRYIGRTFRELTFEQLRATERSETRKRVRKKKRDEAIAAVRATNEPASIHPM